MSLLDCRELADKFLATSRIDDSSLYSYFTDTSKSKSQFASTSSIFESFYQLFYSNGYNYDISGYSLIFFHPPDLSGLGPSFSPEVVLVNKFRDFMTLAVEITPIDASLSATEVAIGPTSYKLPNYLSQSGDFSVTFLDTDDLRLYTYHMVWLKYIKDVIRGELSPVDYYIDNNEVDYFGSMYVIKYDADMETPRLIGKAAGIYPNGSSGKEVFGNRAQHQLSMINMSYSALTYTEEPYNAENGIKQAGLFAEFKSKIGKLYD